MNVKVIDPTGGGRTAERSYLVALINFEDNRAWAVVEIHFDYSLVQFNSLDPELDISGVYEGISRPLGDITCPKSVYNPYRRYYNNDEEKAALIEIEAWLESPSMSKWFFHTLIGKGYKFMRDKRMALSVAGIEPYF